MKPSYKRSAIILGGIIAIVAIITLASSFGLGGRASAVQNASGELSSPIGRATGSVISWLEDIYGYIYKYDSLREEVESLKVQLAEAEAQARDNIEYKEEAQRLRELLGFSEKHTDFVLEPAKIIGWNSSNWASSFTISKGSQNGIEVGDCVITEAGFLCGLVTELGSTWATVRSVIDADMYIGVLVGEGGNAAMAIGDFPLMQDGKLKLYYLTEGTRPNEGDVILTSGRGGFFPQGLVVGTVCEVRMEAGGQTIYGIIKPSCDYDTMSQVYVVKDYKTVE